MATPKYKVDNKTSRGRRFKAVIARWKGILVLGALAVPLVFFLLAKAPFDTGSWPKFIIAIGCVAFVGWRYRDIWRWLGLRHIATYPPAWLAALIGLPLLIEFHPALSGNELRHYSFLLWVPVCLLFVFGVARAAFGEPQRDLKLAISVPDAKPQALSEWINSDNPISKIEDDLFGYLRPICGQVLAGLNESAPGAVAIVGPLGTGKSSVYEVVASVVLRTRTSIVRISLWPHVDTPSALSAVIESLTREIGKYVATSELDDVAESYLELVDSVAGPWRTLVSLTGKESPSEQLEKIDSIANAIDLRLVLWVEDLERFAELSISEQQPDYARAEPLRALLAKLSCLESVRVVLSVAAVDALRDIHKVATRVVTIPFVDRTALAGVAHRALQEMRDSPPRVLSWNNRQAIELSKEAGVVARGRATRDEISNWVAELCPTPRQLKFVLRQCRIAWTALRGEIDFDDLVIATAVRHSFPAVFELINENIGVLRIGELNKEKRSGASEFRSSFLSLMKLRDRATATLESCLSRLFPGWDRGDSASDSRRDLFPQSLSQTHADYWARLITCHPGNGFSDQTLMRSFVDWRLKRGDGFVSEFLGSGDMRVVAFAAVDRGALKELLADALRADSKMPLIEERIGTKRVTAAWLVFLRVGDHDAVNGALLDWIQSGEMQLDVAAAVSYFFLNDPSVEGHSLERSVRASLRGALDKRLAKEFGGNPDVLIAALRAAKGEHVFEQTFAPVASFPNWSTKPDASWTAFADVVCSALLLAPDVVAPHLARLLVKTSASVIDWNAILNQSRLTQQVVVDGSRADSLFGSKLSSLDIPENVVGDSNSAPLIAELRYFLRERNSIRGSSEQKA